MELTPNEMKNHEFATQMRGYDKAEVNAFIEGAANALEEAYAKIEQLNRDNEALSSRYEELKRLEDTIKSAVLEAQKNADQIIKNAKKESELMLSEAKSKGEKLYEEKQKQMGDLDQKIQKLDYTKEQFYSKLRSEIEAHLKLVDSICPPNNGMKSEELNAEQRAKDEGDTARVKAPAAESKPESKPAPVPTPPTASKEENPSLDMHDDDIEAALENLNETPAKGIQVGDQNSKDAKDDEPTEVNKKAEPEEAMANVGNSETSDVKEEVKDGQSKGYDF